MLPTRSSQAARAHISYLNFYHENNIRPNDRILRVLRRAFVYLQECIRKNNYNEYNHSRDLSYSSGASRNVYHSNVYTIAAYVGCTTPHGDCEERMPSVSVTYTVGVSRYGRFNMGFGYLEGFYDSKLFINGIVPSP